MYELFIEQIGSDVFVTTQQLHNIFFIQLALVHNTATTEGFAF